MNLNLKYLVRPRANESEVISEYYNKSPIHEKKEKNYSYNFNTYVSQSLPQENLAGFTKNQPTYAVFETGHVFSKRGGYSIPCSKWIVNHLHL